MKWFFTLWRVDPEGLERAKQADAAAARRLDEAKERLAQAQETSRWAERTLARNHLTERFITTLRHGGQA